MRETVIYKGTGTAVAKMVANETTELDVAAVKVLAAAKVLAALHVRSARYLKSLQVGIERGKKGVKDRTVFSDDPQSHIIESGHAARRGADMVGPMKWVPGQHILERAARMSERRL